jgi:hypothetical protein
VVPQPLDNLSLEFCNLNICISYFLVKGALTTAVPWTASTGSFLYHLTDCQRHVE